VYAGEKVVDRLVCSPGTFSSVRSAIENHLARHRLT
jgi:hypothetical protein